MIKQEPRMDLKDAFAGLFVFIGLIFFLVILHLMAINTVGDTNQVMNTVFIIFLKIFQFLAIMSGIFIIWHFLKWLVWFTTTPRWAKNEMRRK